MVEVPRILVREPGGGHRRPREQDGAAAQVRRHVVTRTVRQAEVAAAGRGERSLVGRRYRLHCRLRLDKDVRGIFDRLSLPVQRRWMAPKRYGKNDDHNQDDAHQHRPALREDGGLGPICAAPGAAAKRAWRSGEAAPVGRASWAVGGAGSARAMNVWARRAGCRQLLGGARSPLGQLPRGRSPAG